MTPEKAVIYLIVVLLIVFIAAIAGMLRKGRAGNVGANETQSEKRRPKYRPKYRPRNAGRSMGRETQAEKRRLLGSSLDDAGIDTEAENLYSLIGDNTKRR